MSGLLDTCGHRESANAGSHRMRPGLGDESGFVLVLALVLMAVLMVGMTTALSLSTSSERHAGRGNAGQKAYALAESGVNNAVARLAAHYPNATGAADSSWVGGGTPVSTGGGTVTWNGSFDTATSKWTITSTGSVPKPRRHGNGHAHVLGHDRRNARDHTAPVHGVRA